VERPPTRYAKSGDISIAYQVMGEGPLDLIVVPGWISNLDMHWQMLGFEAWVARITSFCRLIVFDKRGSGLSDRDVGDSTLEERMDDLRAVLDAVGSERAAVHTGECERATEKLGGIAVHIGARVMSLAKPGEVLVSSTVRDLVSGSGLGFVDRGVHTLKGVPGAWTLYAVE